MPKGRGGGLSREDGDRADDAGEAAGGAGEALVVVILGGLGTLIGPILGAILFVVLKHEISAITPYWHAIVGLILIAVVMSRAKGVFGFIEARVAARSQKTLIQEAKIDA